MFRMRNEEDPRKTYSHNRSIVWLVDSVVLCVLGGPMYMGLFCGAGSSPACTRGPLCAQHLGSLSGLACPLGIIGSGQAHLIEGIEPAPAFPFSLGSQTS